VWIIDGRGQRSYRKTAYQHPATLFSVLVYFEYIFLAGEGAHPLLNTLAFFSETHPKQFQCDVSLHEWWHVMMPGFVETPVIG